MVGWEAGTGTGAYVCNGEYCSGRRPFM